jgi:hypothetical protein
MDIDLDMDMDLDKDKDMNMAWTLATFKEPKVSVLPLNWLFKLNLQADA